MMALGRVAHETTIRTFGLKQKDYKFAHGALHRLPNGLILVDSYHVSRYNVNTGVLTEAMFMDALGTVKEALRAD
jgi:uracil-DNA glycosylase